MTILMEFKIGISSYKPLWVVLLLVFLLPVVNGRCRNGYVDIGQESKYCYFVPYLKNNLNNQNQHPDDGKTWVEANQLCQIGGGTLAYFESESELNTLLNFFQSHYVIRDMFRDQTVVKGVYFPDNSTLCPEPPLGCAIWYFGLIKDPSTNTYRWVNNAPLSFDLWAPEYPEISLISASNEPKNCVAGPCSSSFGLCKVPCSRKLSFICMVDKNSPISSPLSLNIPQVQTTTTATPTTDKSESSHMPQSIGTMGRLIMNVAEMVLPEMLMNTVTRFMQDTNGLIYSGYSISDSAFDNGIHSIISEIKHLIMPAPKDIQRNQCILSQPR